jgi:mRNA-degrading endonuclease RelE of RelBE toxin-antitoxin system
MSYKVKVKKKVARGLMKLPQNVKKLLFLLIEDLNQMDQFKNVGIIFLPSARKNIIVT